MKLTTEQLVAELDKMRERVNRSSLEVLHLIGRHMEVSDEGQSDRQA